MNDDGLQIPSCVFIPTAIERRYALADRLIAQASVERDPKKAMSLVKKAVRTLKATRPMAVLALRKRVSTDCGLALLDAIDHVLERAQQLVLSCKHEPLPICLSSITTTTTSTSSTTTTSTSTSTTTSTTLPVSVSRLRLLLGTWDFTYTIIGTYTDSYSLSSIQDSGRGWLYADGTNLIQGNRILAARIRDVDPSSTLPYEFSLVDPESSLLCEVFAFNVAGASSASGEVAFFYGDCQTPLSETTYPFVGSKF